VLDAPSGNFEDPLDPDVLSGGPDVIGAFLGVTGSRVRASHDGRAVIVSAAHPIWVGDQVAGAVVVEESTNPILTVRNQALERLLLITLAGFAVVAVVVFGFASRLSTRICRLRDAAEGAIDGRGRLTGAADALGTAARAGDEVGDLSRSFSALLARLAQHHSYLESMASRLSHELRTPIAVVRSSLENLHAEPLPESAQTYMARAEAGLARLTRILARMSEASRMEQSLATTETERFDLAAVVAECASGYRSAYPAARFEAQLPAYPVWVRGAPDLAAQMLDKLVENAVDFARPGTPVVIAREVRTTTCALSVSNRGPGLPAELEGRLFESMVSARKGEGGDEPHLGLGLFVARMIAAFHGGELRAGNLPDGDGVRFTAVLRLA
jgi:signal transduction histidine kinase